MDKYNIMASSKLTDIEKLIAVFEVDKETIKQNNAELYYCLLAIKDQIRQGYRLTKQ